MRFPLVTKNLSYRKKKFIINFILLNTTFKVALQYLLNVEILFKTVIFTLNLILY